MPYSWAFSHCISGCYLFHFISGNEIETSALFRNFTIRYVPSHRKEGRLPSKTFKLAGSAKDWCVPLKRFNSLKVLLKRLHLLPLHHQRKTISFYTFVLTLHHKPNISFSNFISLVWWFVFFFFKSILVPSTHTYILFGAWYSRGPDSDLNFFGNGQIFQHRMTENPLSLNNIPAMQSERSLVAMTY